MRDNRRIHHEHHEVTALSTSLRWRIKRLYYFADRLRGSLAQRGVRPTIARIAQAWQKRPVEDTSLQLLPLDANTQGLTFPAEAAPQVSIVIPVYGKVAYTIACLRSLQLHRPQVRCEIIVVDDASADGSAHILQSIDGLRVHVNATNLGFVGSCNAGAALARGDYLLFLNNDTQVTAGWLDALLHCFDVEPDCGLAGSRLVYPDGRLQEAGGWVFNDGNAWNVGRFEQRDAPAYRYRRRVDYVSGAAILIRRAQFEAVGGFDQRYAPAYYEDTDLAFAIRASGLSVYYEPQSVVVHCEGISAGTDLGAGMKQHQLINRSTFVEKWHAALAAQPVPGTPIEQLWQRYSRGHILVVDAMTPDPSRDSGSLRLIGMLRILHQEGWRVAFAPDDGLASEADIVRLGDIGVEVLHRPWNTNIPTWLREHGAGLHAVMLCRHTVAGQYVDAVRRFAPQARLMLDTVDLHFLREQRAAEHSGNTQLRRKADASQRSELALIRSVDVSLVVSPHEQQLLQALAPQARVALLSNIHELHGRSRGYAGRKDLLFVGGYGHPPNADAMHWLADAILPALKQAMPDIQLHVLGDVPDAERAQLQQAGLSMHGRVHDLAPWFDNCLASLAPLRFGAGVKGKVNMAMSYGVPVVATAIAVEGMHLTDGKDVLQADEPAGFVRAIQRLKQDEALWDALSAASLDNVRLHFSPDAARATLRALLD